MRRQSAFASRAAFLAVFSRQLAQVLSLHTTVFGKLRYKGIFLHSRHHQEAEKRPGEAVKQGRQTAEQKSRQADPGSVDGKRLPASEQTERQKDRQIGKPKLHPRHAEGQGDQRLHISKDQGQSKQKAEPRRPYRMIPSHHILPSAIPSSRLQRLPPLSLL